MSRMLVVVCLVASMLLLLGGCGKAEKAAGDAKPSAAASASGPCPTILLAQAQFVETSGPPVPASRLIILRQVGDEWTSETIEDPESNVFHKAIVFADSESPDAAPGILTIGANAAALKLWHKSDGNWTAETLWTPKFGGKQDRLRDFEIGDVIGDGKPDFVVVTHDQGVVAVLSRGDTGWQATEIDRDKGIWIHECELGDLDGDGALEVYATPSNPNKFDGKEQPGKITFYRRTDTGFERGIVEEFPLRHVKEILATTIDGSGPVLLAAVEAELGTRADAPPDAKQTLIKRYRFDNGKYVGDVVCALPDSLCRFLNAGDIDGDGRPEVIASTHNKGLWLVRPGPAEWQVELIDADAPKQFEHATVLADLDGDGTQEIYVVNDEYEDSATKTDVPGRVSRYRWSSEGWQRTTLSAIDGRTITFGITTAKPGL